VKPTRREVENRNRKPEEKMECVDLDDALLINIFLRIITRFSPPDVASSCAQHLAEELDSLKVVCRHWMRLIHSAAADQVLWEPFREIISIDRKQKEKLAGSSNGSREWLLSQLPFRNIKVSVRVFAASDSTPLCCRDMEILGVPGMATIKTVLEELMRATLAPRGTQLDLFISDAPGTRPKTSPVVAMCWDGEGNVGELGYYKQRLLNVTSQP